MAQSDGLVIRLFGHADVSWDGSPVKFAKRATTLAMLAHLVLQRGRAISRESLAFTLFPDVDEATALAELRRYLYLANKALPQLPGNQWLFIDAETVCWNGEAAAFIDTVAFERLASDPETQAEAIELYSRRSARGCLRRLGGEGTRTTALAVFGNSKRIDGSPPSNARLRLRDRLRETSARYGSVARRHVALPHGGSIRVGRHGRRTCRIRELRKAAAHRAIDRTDGGDGRRSRFDSSKRSAWRHAVSVG